jgi:hypothetical protein
VLVTDEIRGIAYIIITIQRKSKIRDISGQQSANTQLNMKVNGKGSIKSDKKDEARDR